MHPWGRGSQQLHGGVLLSTVHLRVLLCTTFELKGMQRFPMAAYVAAFCTNASNQRLFRWQRG